MEKPYLPSICIHLDSNIVYGEHDHILATLYRIAHH